MKKIFTILAAAALTSGLSAQDKAPAFPGAEGHGRYTTGGRGGEIRHVTNLNDSGEGSLRAALSGSAKKIIVFDVSGYIDLKSNIQVSSNTTILGQTAPGDGITLRYYTLEFTKGDNTITRFIRSRRSQVKDVNDGADAAWGRRRHDIIIDHCSFSWSIDECASFYDNKNFTLQWCTVAEGLANPGHTKGSHSYGGIWGGKDASFHHNFIAHVQNRAPRFNGARYEWTGWDKNKYINTVDAERVDFRNNLLYNWGNGNGSYGVPGGGYINIINNYYKAGPGTKRKTNVTEVSVGSSGNSTNVALRGYASRYYINGNYVTAAGENASNYDWKGVSYDGGLSTIDGEKYIPDEKHLYGEDKTYVQNSAGKDCIRLKLDEPIDAGLITTHDATETYETIMAFAGASLTRDAVDARYMEECSTGTVTFNGDVPYTNNEGKTFPKSDTKGIPDWVNDPEAETQNPGVPSYPALKEETRPAGFDTDNDGIPDEWEIKNGLDPNDPSDASTYSLDPRGWYTNIEVYANAIVEHIIKAQNAGAETGFDEYFPEIAFTSGIDDITVNKPAGEIVSIEYYSLDGRRIPEPNFGLTIRRITYADGTVESDKVIK